MLWSVIRALQFYGVSPIIVLRDILSINEGLLLPGDGVRFTGINNPIPLDFSRDEDDDWEDNDDNNDDSGDNKVINKLELPTLPKPVKLFLVILIPRFSSLIVRLGEPTLAIKELTYARINRLINDWKGK